MTRPQTDHQTQADKWALVDIHNRALMREIVA
jgi:hypothetical protein